MLILQNTNVILPNDVVVYKITWLLYINNVLCFLILYVHIIEHITT